MAIEKEGALVTTDKISGGQGKIVFGAASAEAGGIVIDAGTISGVIGGATGLVLDNAFGTTLNAPEQAEFINVALKAGDAVSGTQTFVFLEEGESVTPATGGASVITGGHGLATFSKEDEVSVQVRLNDMSFPFAIEDSVTMTVAKGAIASYVAIASVTASAPVTLFPGNERDADFTGLDEMLSGKGTASISGVSTIKLNNLNNAYPFTLGDGDDITANNASIIFLSTTA